MNDFHLPRTDYIDVCRAHSKPQCFFFVFRVVDYRNKYLNSVRKKEKSISIIYSPVDKQK